MIQVSDLLDTTGFTPRWDCGVWPDELGWLHIYSDILIFAAYFAIPITLAYFVLKRRDLPYPRIFVLFILFIASCGTTHLVEAIMFYKPVYRLSGMLKGITAVVSWITIFALIPAIPKALRLPGLEKVNEDLNAEIEQRRRTEALLQKLTSDLEQSNRDLEQFAYIASHDLQEPLRKIEAYTSFATEDCADLPADLRSHLSRIESSAGRMRQLINDLLDYSRLDRVTTDIAEVNLGEIARECLDDLHLADVDADIQIGELPTVSGVPIQLRQVFANLLSNAVKFRQADRKLHISIQARRIRDRWLIDVKDNGIGFENAYAARIFEPFQRLHTADQYPGSGIGLAICHRIIRKHHGELTVDSHPGVGTTFTVALPALPDAPPTATRAFPQALPT